jgi:ribosomal protein S7
VPVDIRPQENSLAFRWIIGYSGRGRKMSEKLCELLDATNAFRVLRKRKIPTRWQANKLLLIIDGNGK